MSEHLRQVETYNGLDIKYIPFAEWYAVFTHKDDGYTAMHHFDTREEAREFIDTHQKKLEKKYWWDK